MDFKLIIVPEAEIEISEAIVYYESKQQGLGSIFVQYLDGYFYTLVKGKAFFEIKRKPTFNELPIKKFPFIIIYEVVRNTIIVYSVFNTHQNPDKKIM